MTALILTHTFWVRNSGAWVNQSGQGKVITSRRTKLSPGPKRQPEIEQEAAGCGITWATVRRARAELNIKSHKDRFSGGWKWYTKEQLDQKQNQENVRR